MIGKARSPHGVRDSILIVGGRQPVLVFSCHPMLLSLVRVRRRQGYALVVFACSQPLGVAACGQKTVRLSTLGPRGRAEGPVGLIYKYVIWPSYI